VVKDSRKAIVADGYDALAETYLEWASATTDDGRARMSAAFKARLTPGSRVLDLGCGAGLPSTKELARRFTVTGVDVSGGQVAAARRNVPEASFIEADLAEIDFPPGSWDGVTAFYSISHVPRDEHAALFGRIRGWLRPGGVFLATLGAGDNPDWTGEWLGRPMFFSAFDADTNRRLLAAAGFTLLIDEVITTHEPEGSVDFLWVLASRTGEGPHLAIG
jgi:cyclopropane fatty-acyl-phospholipid synthase-like methyltransferase